MTRLSLFELDPTEPSYRTVSELTARIKATLELGFAEVALRGEVSNLARPRSGHVYLSLKDDSAQVRAVLWKSDAERLVFDLTDGLAVKVRGKLSVYAPRGEYQVTIREIEPEGIGALELAFRQTVARLAAEGLFDPARKRPLPRYPRRIVVVTSPTGQAPPGHAMVYAYVYVKGVDPRARNQGRCRRGRLAHTSRADQGRRTGDCARIGRDQT
jgi:exodeoxyribonuclease VII large subunit